MSDGAERSPEVVSPAPKAGDSISRETLSEAHETLEAMVRAADRAERAERAARKHEENALLWCVGAVVAAYVGYRVFMAMRDAIADGTIRVDGERLT